jgi:hypothetical protein
MTIDVAAAVIRDEAGRYLITRRRQGTHLEGLWEFPGGKREPGETLEAATPRTRGARPPRRQRVTPNHAQIPGKSARHSSGAAEGRRIEAERWRHKMPRQRAAATTPFRRR